MNNDAVLSVVTISGHNFVNVSKKLEAKAFYGEVQILFLNLCFRWYTVHTIHINCKFNGKHFCLNLFFRNIRTRVKQSIWKDR